MNLISFLTAFGLGSIVTALVQSYLAQRSRIEDRNFEEKKTAYIGLLEAYHRASVENSDEAAKGYAYWQMRCDLVAPKATRQAIAKIIETNDDQHERNIAHISLKEALRNDLGIV